MKEIEIGKRILQRATETGNWDYSDQYAMTVAKFLSWTKRRNFRNRKFTKNELERIIQGKIDLPKGENEIILRFGDSRFQIEYDYIDDENIYLMKFNYFS